jgi:glycosyltransferase involved in cell wall biosynthesis
MAPKVSVCVPTYNHEKYIRQTLNGVLMQQTNFEIEIVIGDDASTDNNQQIIQEYVDKYPNIFQAFLHK